MSLIIYIALGIVLGNFLVKWLSDLVANYQWRRRAAKNYARVHADLAFIQERARERIVDATAKNPPKPLILPPMPDPVNWTGDFADDTPPEIVLNRRLGLRL
ncbi:MAG: hypothetical protein ACLQKH_15140 [Steroidobacteraceae bacterium]